MAADSNAQKYDVQTFINNKWEVETTFLVHERASAIRKAKNITMNNKDLPVRVIFDNYNSVSDVHTQAVIFRNNVKEHKNAQNDNESPYFGDDKRIRLSAFEYFGTLMGIAGIGVCAGVFAAVALNFLMNVFNIQLDGQARQMMLLAMMALVGLITLVSTFQYFTTLYVFDWRKNKKISLKEKEQEVMTRAKNTSSTLGRNVRYDMQRAAVAISNMPVETHEKPAYETEDELVQHHYDLTPSVATTPAAAPPDQRKIKVFFATFISDCLKHLQEQNVLLTSQKQFGLSLFVMGGVQRLSEKYDFDEDETQQLTRDIFILLNLKGEALEDFLLGFETFYDTPAHARLIDKGADTVDLVDAGDENGAQRVVTALESWQAEMEVREGYSLKFAVQSFEEGMEQDAPFDHEAWLASLQGFRPLTHEKNDQGLAFVFATVKQAFRAAQHIQHHIQTLNAQSEGVDYQVNLLVWQGEKHEGLWDILVGQETSHDDIYLSCDLYSELQNEEGYQFVPFLKPREDEIGETKVWAYAFAGWKEESEAEEATEEKTEEIEGDEKATSAQNGRAKEFVFTSFDNN